MNRLHALALTALALISVNAGSGEPKTVPPCAQMEGRDVTLRGKISETYDNLSPGEDFGNELALDPQETVFLLTLRNPVCLAASPSGQSRPVVQPRVTIVELLVNDAEAAQALRAQAGKTRKVEGKISENVWWHYKATMRLVVTGIY